MTTLVIDTGQDTVGVFSVEDEIYTYYRGPFISEALARIAKADEVVTYNGNNHDLKELAKFSGLEGGFPLKGIHSDMRSICWSERIWGASLKNTYLKHFDSLPKFPDTHEGANESDVYMTFKLWELWKSDRLRVVDGQYR